MWALFLRIVCAVCLAILLARFWIGPIAGLVSARSTLNVEACAFLALILLLLPRRLERSIADARDERFLRRLILPGALCLASVCPYLIELKDPFVFDDYVHLARPSPADPLKAVLHYALLEHPLSGDYFFRPLGVFYYWFVFKWAGTSSLRWHLCGLLFQVANTLLCYVFLKRVSTSAPAAFAGALLFAWSAAHVEAVCWTAASYDLLAALFCLLTLCMVTERKAAAIAVGAVLACLSKESAYCLPLLALVTALLFEGAKRQRALVNSVWVALGCLTVFGYRIWFLRGIGGYNSSAGTPMILSVHPASAVEALCFRMWALFFVPLNWSASPGTWLKLAATLMLVSIAVLAIGRNFSTWRPDVRLLGALLFTICAALPVFSLLLIGSDFAGSRVLYLPSVGMALLCTLLVAAPVNGRRAWVPVSAYLSIAVFQLAALLHSERIWGRQTELARRACVDVASFVRRSPTADIYATGLPRVRGGVYFLGNGFSDCVQLEGGIPVAADKVIAGAPPASRKPGDVVLQWDEPSARVVELH